MKKASNYSTAPGFKLQDRTLDIKELKELVNSNDSESAVAQEYFKSFYLMWTAGEDLSKLLSPIAFDSTAPKSSLAGIQVLNDQIHNHSTRGKSLFRDTLLEDLLEGNMMPMQRSFKNKVDQIWDVSKEIGLLGSSDAVTNFKRLLGTTIGKDAFTEREHRRIDRLLFEYMATLPGSPLGKYKTVENVERLLIRNHASEGGYKTFPAIVKQLSTKYPILQNNEFFSRLEEAKSNETKDNRLFNVIFNPGATLDPKAKDQVITDYLELLEHPEHYIDSSNPDHSAEEIKDFAELTIANQLLTTGFTPSGSSYYDVIPMEKIIELEQGPYIRGMAEEVRSNPNFFNDALFEIVRHIGVLKIDNRPLVGKGQMVLPPGTKMTEESLDADGNKVISHISVSFILKNAFPDKATGEIIYKGGPMPIFVTTYNSKARYDKTSLYVRTSLDAPIYKKVNHKSHGFQLSEINLTDKDGNLVSSSVVPSRNLGLTTAPADLNKMIKQVASFIHPKDMTPTNPDEFLGTKANVVGKENC